MNIGVFIENINPVEGGGYTYEADIVDALCELHSESKHQFFVFSQNRNYANLDKKFDSKRLKYIAISQSAQLYIKYKMLLRKLAGIISPQRAASLISNPFDKLLAKYNIKVVWYPTPYFIDTDLPYIFTVWDLAHRQQPYFPEVERQGVWETRETFYSRVLRRALFVVVGSEVGKNEVEYFYQVPSARIKMLPLPTPRFSIEGNIIEKPSIIDKFHIPHEYLFYPSQFWPHKNHANLLLSLDILRERYKVSIPIVFVGADKGNQLYINQLVKELDLVSQVFILGFVSRVDLIELYQNALALTYVTFFGPDNLPPLEAFALGTPVIASNVSGAEEQLGDAALLVDPKNPEEIAEAIYNLYKKPALRSALIKKGRERSMQWSARDYMRSIFSLVDEFEPIRRCWEQY